MFLDVKDLAVRKLRIRKTYAPGSVDFHSSEIKQLEPLEVNATAELLEGQIRVEGQLDTKIELQCARCLEPVVEEVNRAFDLFYAPLPKDEKPKEDRLKDDDTEIGFFQGEGLFLADVVKEQVLLALPLKVSCQSDCRGLCPNCGANLNHEECRCETHATDPRLAPLARLKQDWLKKQYFPGPKAHRIRPLRRERGVLLCLTQKDGIRSVERAPDGPMIFSRSRRSANVLIVTKP